MSTQPTSAAALREATTSGQTMNARTEVLRAFQHYGRPGTSAEVLHAAGLADNLNLMRARVTELADAGDIVAAGISRCSVSGRRAILWRILRGDEVRQPRVKAIRVEFTSTEALAVSNFVDAARWASPALASVHAKILAAYKDTAERDE